MIQINPKQVEWLVANKPDTEHTYANKSRSDLSKRLCIHDVSLANGINYTYYLTPDVYNSLPQTFKQLADD